jgi:ribosome-associated protein
VGGDPGHLGGDDSFTGLRQDQGVEQIQVIQISGQSIRLGQLLKLAGVVQSGGESKQLLAHGVLVNGVAEGRRGRQLRDGDIVEAGGLSARVAADPAAGAGRGERA